MKTYEAPALRLVGTIHEMTLQAKEKCGNSMDAFSNLSGLSGTIVNDEDCLGPGEDPATNL